MATNALSIQFLLSQVRRAAGSLEDGTVTAYAAGTTTPKNIWLDRGKQTLAANPYTLDANGTAALFGDGLYRFVIKTSTGVTVYDRDYIAIKDASGLAYDVADYTSLAAACAALNGTGATLQYSSNQTLSANLTTDVELMPLNGAVINHSAYTVAYAGSTARWPLSQIFNGTGAVTGLVQAWPEWFGTNITPGTTDMTAAINSALVASKSVKLLGTTYKVTDVLNIYSGTSFRGATPVFGAYIPITPVDGETTFIFAPASEKDLFHVQRTAAEISGGLGNTKYAVEIANIRVVGNSTGAVTYSRYGIYNDTTALSYFYNLSFQRFQIGIYNSFTLTNDFTNVALYNMTVACVKYDTTTSTTDVYTNCKFDSSPWGVIIEKALSIKFINPLFQTLSVGGMNLHKAASGIQVIAGYGEDVPGTDAGSAMFRVGYDGAGSSEDVNQLSVIGGRYGGINGSGTYYGSFLDVDSNYSVRVTDVDVSRFLNLVKATANTRDKSINWNNNSFTACTNSFVDTTGKITGLYYVADLSTGNFLRLFADRITLDGPMQSVGVTTTLLTYADNAAALTGGLTAGMMYKTATGEVKIVY